jgi:hypothetical protein
MASRYGVPRGRPPLRRYRGRVPLDEAETPTPTPTPTPSSSERQGSRPLISVPPAPRAGARLGRLLLADKRGLTAAGGVAVAVLAGLLGGVIDVITGSGLRGVFAAAFVVGCIFAALAVHREDLFAVVVMPPLVYVVLVLLASATERSGGSGSWLSRQILELATALILSAPVLFLATGGALIVALLRGRGARSTTRQTASPGVPSRAS